MPARLVPVSDFIGESTLFAFLFTLTRIGGVIAFLPLPGVRATPEPVRVVLALAFTIALWPVWMTRQMPADFGMPQLVAGLAAEAALGLAVGLVIGIVIEVFQAAAQVVSLQAGFSYASTIDPTSGADSPVLVMLAQMTCALLFVSSGADLAFFRVLAESTVFHPPGTGGHGSLVQAGNAIYHFGSLILLSGLRLAAPIAVLLLLADILLAVFGRLQPALQLTTLAFPLKIVGALLLFGAMLRFYPRYFEILFGQALRLMQGLLYAGRG